MSSVHFSIVEYLEDIIRTHDGISWDDIVWILREKYNVRRMTPKPNQLSYWAKQHPNINIEKVKARSSYKISIRNSYSWKEGGS